MARAKRRAALLFGAWLLGLLLGLRLLAAFARVHRHGGPGAASPGLARRCVLAAGAPVGPGTTVTVALRSVALPSLVVPSAGRTLLTAVGVASVLGAVSCSALAILLLLGQYGPVLRYRKRLPRVDLGLPILGHSLNILKHGWSGGGGSWLRRLQAKNGRAFLFNLLFVNRVAVDYPLYEERMQELERAGELRPLFSKSMQRLLGEHSILTLPGGRGGDAHARVRKKIAPALAPRQLAQLGPEVERLCRDALEEMADETTRIGQTTLLPRTSRLTQNVAAASLLGRFADAALPHLGRLSDLVDAIIDGLFTIPVPSVLGKPTLFGRALAAKRQACELIDALMGQARAEASFASASGGDVLVRLAQDSEDGLALTAEEVHDTVVTIAFAGKVTAAAALPVAVVELAKRPEWAARIAADPPRLLVSGSAPASVEERPGPALQFIREAMRVRPPAAAFYRASDSWIELGPALGAVPPGTPVAVCMDFPGAGLAGSGRDEFEPGRWTEEYARKHFVFFGGTTPHACPGRGLALLEMQVFLHLLCRDYDFQVLSEATCVDRAFTQVKYKDGLPMRVVRRTCSRPGRC